MPTDPTRRLRIVTVSLLGAGALVAMVAFGAIGIVLGRGVWLAPIGAVAGAAVAWTTVRHSSDRVLSALGAVELHDAPRVTNLVDGLCVANGIPVPDLKVVETPGRNACTVGLRAEVSTLVVTRGLVDHLGRIELEGVVARELALIKSGHTALATVVARLAALWAAAPTRLLMPRADVVADVDAVGLTRYPPGLLDALASIRVDATVPTAPSWTRHIWIEDPVASVDGFADSFHSPIDERIATLREL